MAKQKAEKTGKGHKYDASNISVLEGLEPVRKRPGMYIGSTGPEGLHHLVKEIFDNSRDEAMAGEANEVEIVLLPGDVVRVADNGRGIPVSIHPKTKVSALETVMTTLDAGGKFDQDSYKISGGLHGVGASVVNALSEWATVRVHRDGGVHSQEYDRGVRRSKVREVGKSKKNGTIVTFKADHQIFSETVYDWNKLVRHMREQAYLVKGFRVRLIDARESEFGPKDDADAVFWFSELGIEAPSQSFYFEGGLYSLVKFLNIHESPIHKHIFYVEKDYVDEATKKNITIEIGLQYIDDISSHEITFANNTSTPEGGTHLTGFRTALTRAVNDYAKKNNLAKGDGGESFTGDDVREGLTAVISVKLPDPQFEGQTKAKLGSMEAQSATQTIFSEAFALYLEENPEDGRAIISKSVLAMRARKAAKAAKDSVLRKGALEGMTLPGKLADCQSKSAEESELFIVEGDSAGGSAKGGRDRRMQAILPLRGKILNVERARLDKMLGSEQVKNIIIALGTAIGDVFDVTKLRYHKLIIATDADVDGAHIRTLLLTLFYRHFRPLIDGGYIYIAQPPLYKIVKGKDARYAYTEDGKTEVLKEMGVDARDVEKDDVEEKTEEEAQVEAEVEVKEGVKKVNVRIQRYKGLGEMNAKELWETTMDPERRILKQITVEDASLADETFDMLMGSEVAPRKLFIQTHAKMATLDV